MGCVYCEKDMYLDQGAWFCITPDCRNNRDDPVADAQYFRRIAIEADTKVAAEALNFRAPRKTNVEEMFKLMRAMQKGEKLVVPKDAVIPGGKELLQELVYAVAICMQGKDNASEVGTEVLAKAQKLMQ